MKKLIFLIAAIVSISAQAQTDEFPGTIKLNNMPIVVTIDTLTGTQIDGTQVKIAVSDVLSSGLVTLGTNQTITGSKTFNTGSSTPNINLTYAGAGNSMLSTNTGVGNSIGILNSGPGTGLRVTGESTGNNIVSVANSGATGFNYVGTFMGSTTFTVSKEGDIVANSLQLDALQLEGSDIFTIDSNTPEDINIISGSNDTDGAGSNLFISSGAGTVTGQGGALTITTGAGSTGGGGAGAARQSGQLTVTTGTGPDSNTNLIGGRGGNAIFSTGNGGHNTSAEATGSGGVGGDHQIYSGNGGDTNSTGTGSGGGAGEIIIKAGNGGNATAGTGDGGKGGMVVITAGNGGTSVGGSPGSSGKITLNSPVQISSGNVPTTATDPGNVGDIAWDASYFYWCIAPNTWVRAAGTTW